MIVYESMAQTSRENGISDSSIRRAWNGMSNTVNDIIGN